MENKIGFMENSQKYVKQMSEKTWHEHKMGQLRGVN